MQQHRQQHSMLTSFGLLFSPSSDPAAFRIKEKPHNLLNVKMGRDLFDMNLIKLLKILRPV